MPIKCKVVLIGDTKVGKTCVLRRLFGESFDPTFIRTVAGEPLKKKTIVVSEQNVELEFWDAPGSESFRTDVAWYMNNAKAVVIFFDVTTDSSYQNIENWLKFIPEAQSPAQKPPAFIIGNKTDLTKARVIKKEEVEHKAKNWGLPYFETSAKSGTVEDFDKIFTSIAQDILNKSQVLTYSESLPRDNQIKEPRWYKKCVVL